MRKLKSQFRSFKKSRRFFKSIPYWYRDAKSKDKLRRSLFGMIVFVLLFSVSCTSFRAGVEGLEKGEIVIERSANLVTMKINGGL